MSVRILTGDCRGELRTLPDKSVQTCVTSPPYWGLRDYKIAPSVWGGDPECKHEFADKRVEREMRKGEGLARLGLRYRGGGHKQGETPRIVVEQGFCIHCNAWRGCLGLEPTYQLYVEHMVEVFREVWRVLRDDGTLWLNLGDCYATAAGVTREPGGKAPTSNGRIVDWGYRSKAMQGGTKSKRPAMGKHGYVGDSISIDEMSQPNRMPQPGLKPKDMAGIPWRVAFALQDDGWFLRRDIIWHKLNPMPESVYDRPITSHEYLFLFSKSGDTLLWRHRDGRLVYEKPAPDYIWRHRQTREETLVARNGENWFRVNLWRGFDYYYDFAAIMEPASTNSHARAGKIKVPGGWDLDPGAHGTINRKGRTEATYVGVGHNERPRKAVPNEPGPNSRVNVDRVPRPRKAQLEHTGPRPKNNANFDEALGSCDLVAMRNKRSVWSIATEAFKDAHFATFPSALIEPCILAGCPAGGTVLDPFGGAGTTALVADRRQRNAILIELNPEYAAMARRRVEGDAPLLSAVAAE